MTDVDTDRKRQCFAIFPDQFDEGGFIPSLVTEGEAGHQPLRGHGRLSTPWYWGVDYETAKRVCEKANADDFGLTPEQVQEIVHSSIAAQIRGDGL